MIEEMVVYVGFFCVSGTSANSVTLISTKDRKYLHIK